MAALAWRRRRDKALIAEKKKAEQTPQPVSGGQEEAADHIRATSG